MMTLGQRVLTSLIGSGVDIGTGKGVAVSTKIAVGGGVPSTVRVSDGLTPPPDSSAPQPPAPRNAIAQMTRAGNRPNMVMSTQPVPPHCAPAHPWILGYRPKPLLEPFRTPLGILVLVAMALQTSFLTPPVGFAIFYLRGMVPKEVELTHIYKGVIPFVILQLIGLAMLVIWPQLVLWLPSVAYGN